MYKEFKFNLVLLLNIIYYDIIYLLIIIKSEKSIFFIMLILLIDFWDNGLYFFDCLVKEIWIELE